MRAPANRQPNRRDHRPRLRGRSVRIGVTGVTVAALLTGAAWAGTGRTLFGLRSTASRARATGGTEPRVTMTKDGMLIGPAGAASNLGGAPAPGAGPAIGASAGSQRAAGAGSAPGSGLTFGQTPTPARGQIYAKDGEFWLGSSPVLMHGINIAPLNFTDTPTEDAYSQIQGWHMNFVRMRIQWRDIELVAPVKAGSTWVHTYNALLVDQLIQNIQWATAHGQYVLVQDTLMAFWPAWLYLPNYNSHHKTYLDLLSLETDFWTDDLMQQFHTDFWTYIAGEVKALDGIVGYEPIDEPNPGSLPLTQGNEALILNVQHDVAMALRAVDPPRAFFFTTHDSMGAGLPHADLTQWETLGNAVFDLHGYFGGRWGVGLITDPADPNEGQVNGTLLDFTLSDETPPYLGTTLGQYRYVQNSLRYLGQPGTVGAIPLIVAEFGGKGEAEANMMAVMGTMTQAFNMSNISWAAWSWNGADSVRRLDGTLLPWVAILSAAAQYRG